jgi:hypothetical protein
LIGQAWCIEALAAAAHCFDDERYRALAREIFFLHPFDAHVGLWRRVAVDGSYLSYDLTFNHQLWFAASGALIASDQNDEIITRVSRFLEKAARSHLKVARSGRIFHLIFLNSHTSPIQRILHNLVYRAKLFKPNRQLTYKEIGYHAFNLYAFALISSQIPNIFFENRKFHSALAYIHSEDFINGLQNNIYGYPYNPCGFEVAYALQILQNDGTPAERNLEWWIRQQLQQTYDFKDSSFGINTEDKLTLTARVYEATRLADVEIMGEKI